MTSKEALESLMENYYEMCVIDNCNDDMYQKFNNSSERGIIEKDLEILEIIKANKRIIFAENPNYDEMSADDFFKISRWLENE